MSATAAPSALYQGRVQHVRWRPRIHRLAYDVFSLLIDLDELDAMGKRLRLFSVDRWNLVSLSRRQHGPRDGSCLKRWATALLVEHGIVLADPRISLHCFPRILGYGFNPISTYYCFDGDRLVAVICEVKNTFGGQHCYVLPAGPDGAAGPLTSSAPKRFYVSPFIEVDGRYAFGLTVPGPRIATTIRLAIDGAALLTATHVGVRRPLTDGSLLRLLSRHLFMTVWITAAIHLEAVRLRLKQIAFVPEPPTGGATSTRGVNGLKS